MNTDWLIEYPLGFKGYSFLIQDDGDVCYAYLANNDGFIAHVWLYNRTESPTEYPWVTKNFDADLPQKNPIDFIAKSTFHLPISEDEFHIESSISDDSVNGEVKIFIRQQLIACINEQVAVGQSLFASKAGPFARPMVSK